MPNVPTNVEVNPVMPHTSQLSYPLALRWDAPDNSNKFDLEYFRIQVSSPKQREEYILNVTSTELEYPFGLNSSILQSGLNITVSAVSKCLQKGSASTPVIIPEIDTKLTLNTPADHQYKSDLNTTSNGMVHLPTLYILYSYILYMAGFKDIKMTLSKGMHH